MSSTSDCYGTAACAETTFSEMVGDGNLSLLHNSLSTTFYIVILLVMAYLIVMVLASLLSGEGNIGVGRFIIAAIKGTSLVVLVAFLVGS